MHVDKHAMPSEMVENAPVDLSLVCALDLQLSRLVRELPERINKASMASDLIDGFSKHSEGRSVSKEAHFYEYETF